LQLFLPAAAEFVISSLGGAGPRNDSVVRFRESLVPQGRQQSAANLAGFSEPIRRNGRNGVVSSKTIEVLRDFDHDVVMSVTENPDPPPDRAGAAAFDQQLAAARDGNESGLGILLERYRDYLLSIARQETPEEIRGKVGTSDLVQETIIRGYGQFASFEGNTEEQLACWLRQILLNHVRNVAKWYWTDKRDVAREQPVDEWTFAKDRQTPSQEMLSRERHHLLRDALAKLPEELRRVIEMRHRDDCSFAEIARQLNKSEDTARRFWARAIQQLQHELKVSESRA
jgi:RNA polymerase sigma-70 factor (ECF subfamily)